MKRKTFAIYELCIVVNISCRYFPRTNYNYLFNILDGEKKPFLLEFKLQKEKNSYSRFKIALVSIPSKLQGPLMQCNGMFCIILKLFVDTILRIFLTLLFEDKFFKIMCTFYYNIGVMNIPYIVKSMLNKSCKL